MNKEQSECVRGGGAAREDRKRSLGLSDENATPLPAELVQANGRCAYAEIPATMCTECVSNVAKQEN